MDKKDGRFINAINEIHKNAIASLSNKSNEKVEKLFTLPNDYWEVVDFTNMGIIKEYTSMLPKFIKGEKYSLQGVSCDGFDMPTKVYELVDVIDDFHGVPINSVIMKQVDGESGQIYSYSKNDCLQLGIDYQEGLQPFPKNMHWKRLKETIPFDKDDLSSTPRSEVDNTIHHVLLKINGFKDYADGYVLSPSGKLIKEKQFLDSLRIINNEPIVYGNGYVTKDKTKLAKDIVYPKGLIYNHGNFISQDDTIYVLINFVQWNILWDSLYRMPKDSYKIDNAFGIDPKYLANINPKDMFTIAWDELGAFTIEEYEMRKQKQKEALEKKIEKAEIERKQRITLQEQRRTNIKNGLQNVNLNVASELNKIQVPSFTIGNIYEVGYYADSMFSQFNQIIKAIDYNIRITSCI